MSSGFEQTSHSLAVNMATVGGETKGRYIRVQPYRANKNAKVAAEEVARSPHNGMTQRNIRSTDDVTAREKARGIQSER